MPMYDAHLINICGCYYVYVLVCSSRSLSIEDRTRYNNHIHTANRLVDEKDLTVAVEMLESYVEALKVGDLQ